MSRLAAELPCALNCVSKVAAVVVDGRIPQEILHV
jgi:hypothetical protein